jgi:hypothetical protein
MQNRVEMLLFLPLLVVLALVTHAQTIDAGINRDVWVFRDNVYYPIVIVGIDFDGKPGDCSGRPLRCRIPDGMDDWMTKMRVMVVNRSPMSMTCVRVQIQIPRVASEPGRVRVEEYLATIGVIPQEALLPVNSSEPIQVDQQPPIEISPGSTEYVPFAHFVRDGVGLLPRPPVPAQLRLTVLPWDVFFKDGARWKAGSGYVRPDPDKPGWWVRIFSDPKQTPWPSNSN